MQFRQQWLLGNDLVIRRQGQSVQQRLVDNDETDDPR